MYFLPCRRYVVIKATAGLAVCRLILKTVPFYSCLDFTQNLGKLPLFYHIALRTGFELSHPESNQ